MSMVGWLNLLSGAGMIAVGAVAVYGWRRRADAVYFLFGAVSWAVAIAVKIALDLTVTPAFKALLPETLTGVLVLGLYYGLRTGFFESGIPWAAARLAKMRPTFDQAVAVGIGAGAAEAIVLGLLSLLNVLVFILVPGLIDTFSPATQAALQLQFSRPVHTATRLGAIVHPFLPRLRHGPGHVLSPCRLAVAGPVHRLHGIARRGAHTAARLRDDAYLRRQPGHRGVRRSHGTDLDRRAFHLAGPI